MIKRYSDHAANERTFLAWVRTAIAVMAFGFLIERFDLFLQFVAPQLAQQQLAPHGQTFANAAGLAFIGIGVAMIVLAGVRFIRPRRISKVEEDVPSPVNASISCSQCCSGYWASRYFSICRAPCCRRSNAPAPLLHFVRMTLNPASVQGPNEVTIATSVASRPRAIRMRPMRGVLWRASNVYQRPPR